MKLGILIINRNNLNYTINLIDDLSKQNSKDFEVTLIDNGSSEINTKTKLFQLNKDYAFITHLGYTESNQSLNQLWNDFANNSKYEYFCFLNNDVRLPINFVLDTIDVFEIEPSVGCVGHSTNHPSFNKITDLSYNIFSEKYRQGWDFTMRKCAYTAIPKKLKFFCGDDFLYENLYAKGWKFAIVNSSPIIHYCAKTKRIPGVSNNDIIEYKKLGYKHPNLNINFDYCNFRPTFNEIINSIEL